MSLPDFKTSIRGQLIENAPLGEKGRFACGGHADLLFIPADFNDLAAFLKNYPIDQPVCVLGGIANTIVRDGGVRGCVIRLRKAFANIETDGTKITVGTGALDITLASEAAKAGIGGLEFYSGIPGTIGGALRMNAGAHGVETKDVLVEATAIDRAGNIHVMTPNDMGMAYRHTETPEDYIFVSAVFEGRKADPKEVMNLQKQIRNKRESSQPIREKTGGSTFANPSPKDLQDAGLPLDTKVWQLIERAGGRGLKIGGAMMSEMHCNFMINTGDASASDLEDLGEEIRRRVKEICAVQLRWEIKRIGERP